MLATVGFVVEQYWQLPGHCAANSMYIVTCICISIRKYTCVMMMIACLLGWLVGCLVGWLVDRLVD